MLKCHPITAFMKTHANFKKIFLIRVFRFKYIFPIKFNNRILYLMLLPKNGVPFEGQYYSTEWDWQQQDSSWQIICTALLPIAESCQQLQSMAVRMNAKEQSRCKFYNSPFLTRNCSIENVKININKYA